jgi:hypothetical protein
MRAHADKFSNKQSMTSVIGEPSTPFRYVVNSDGRSTLLHFTTF